MSAARALEARLEWHDDTAAHVERLLIRETALQADGRWLAAGTTALDGDREVTLDAAPWCQPAERLPVEIDATGMRLPPDLRPGRHYPARLFGRAVGGPRDVSPVRLVAVEPGPRLRLDPNHPLAGTEVRLVFAPTGQLPAPGVRLAELFAGPGMQRAPADAEACYFPPGATDRADPGDDASFHAAPRLVQHLDARCREELAACYGRLLLPGMRVLDLMASHDSHLPPEEFELAGLGMNADELATNPRLAKRVVQDLNADPQLPWPARHFDAVVCTASIEYLTRPRAVLDEVRRVLRPGGVLALAFSDRWFPTKAIAVWSRLHEFERLGLAQHLLHGAGFTSLRSESWRGAARPADDKYSSQRAFADPLFTAWGYAPG